MYKTSTERRFHELSYQFFRVCHGRCYRVASKVDWQALSRDKIKKVAVLQYSDLFWCGRGDSNLWPLESENSDIQTETASRRDSLSLLHKFARCAKRRQSLFPCPLAALRGVGSQIVVSPAQSWMANSTESFRRKGTASIAYIPARKAISYGKMVILWTFASSSDKGAFPSAPLKREYGEAVD